MMDWASAAPLWVTIALALGGFLFVRRFGGSEALAQLERANRILERRVHELEGENVRLSAEVARLSGETNVALALGPVLAALELHEMAAAKRAEATLNVLDLIAGKVGGNELAA